MDTTLHVVLTETRDRAPLATVCNMPGPEADLTPAQIRRLVRALLAAADECEARALDKKHVRQVRRSYPMGATA